jgi:predicted DNA-binding protein (MmcQ/YjbR family)
MADFLSLEGLCAYCTAKPGAQATFPFGPETLVFKVSGKMFALMGMHAAPLWVSLKCDPEFAELLRAKYDAVEPGYHLNKRHWNSVRLDGSVPEEVVADLINHSYELVVKKLRKADRDALHQ